MRALRVTTIIISAICIAVTTSIWLGIEFQGPSDGDFWPFTLIVAAVDVFYVGLLWVPHQLKNSKHANLSVSIAFGLSIVPVAAFVYLVYLLLNHGVC